MKIIKRSFGSKPKVAILGSGWGGFNFGRHISKSKFDVTLISPRNHFLCTPLLPSTTVGTLEFRCI
jgi:NADH dehydrogenase FAD-containing subunit